MLSMMCVKGDRIWNNEVKGFSNFPQFKFRSEGGPNLYINF